LDLKEVLSKAVEDLHQILPCDRIFIASYEPSEFRKRKIIALFEDPKEKRYCNN
jgi:GAF domain-containing protein